MVEFFKTSSDLTSSMVRLFLQTMRHENLQRFQFYSVRTCTPELPDRLYLHRAFILKELFSALEKVFFFVFFLNVFVSLLTNRKNDKLTRADVKPPTFPVSKLSKTLTGAFIFSSLR